MARLEENILAKLAYSDRAVVEASFWINKAI